MNVEYQSFLDKKKPRALATGIEPPALNPALFDFQSACVDFALRQGRCGLYLETGLGKAKALEAKVATKAMDMGSAIHKLVLGAGSAIKEIVADDFKTKAAQHARDEARAAGLVPLLSADVQHATTVAAAVKSQLADTATTTNESKKDESPS